jgi:hypothetical protein
MTRAGVVCLRGVADIRSIFMASLGRLLKNSHLAAVLETHL